MPNNILEFEKPVAELEKKIEEMRKFGDNYDIKDEINKLEEKVIQLKHNIYDNLTRWQRSSISAAPRTTLHIGLYSNDLHRFC